MIDAEFRPTPARTVLTLAATVLALLASLPAPSAALAAPTGRTDTPDSRIESGMRLVGFNAEVARPTASRS